MVVPNTEAGRLWIYDQRLLELHSVWVGITTLLTFGQWTCRLELNLSKFHLVWFLPSISCCSTSVDCKTDFFLFFQDVNFLPVGLKLTASASTIVAVPCPECHLTLWGKRWWHKPHCRAAEFSEKLRSCVCFTAPLWNPQGRFPSCLLYCSSLGHAESHSDLAKCTTADLLWTCFLQWGGSCSSWGQVPQAIVEL